MAHVVSDECVSCGACAAVCPVEAISEGPTKYVVDPDTCIDCGACEEPCPTGAIAAEQSRCLAYRRAVIMNKSSKKVARQRDELRDLLHKQI